MKRVHYIFFATLILISCEKSISDFQSKNFIKFFGSGYDSKGNDVIELINGDYILTGTDMVNNDDYQILSVKVDENGNLIWSKTFGDDNYKEEGKVVKAVSDGYIIAGTSIVESTGLINSFIMKINDNGEEQWRKLVGKNYFNITINDMVVDGSNIYVAGYSDTLLTDKTDYFVSKLDDSGNKIWEKYYSIGKNSSFKKIFLSESELLLVGTDGIENKISIVTIAKSNGNPTIYENTSDANEAAGDASFNGDLYLLANVSGSSTKLSKLNSSHTEQWHTETISSIIGKSVAYNSDETLMVCGESTDAGNSIINFIKVDKNGTAYYGPQYFKTFQGTIGKLLQTRDKGLILVGTTNATYGTTVQLIKTDKDYFMLKN